MHDKIHQIAEQITALENELQAALEQQEAHLRYQIEGRRITFERAVREAHRKVRIGVFRWFTTVRPQNFLTAPVIYGMIVPLLLFDLCISFYQLSCFPLYRITRVRHRDYIVFDHQHLAYLNIIEKFDCLYCSYGVGLLAYAQEIIARTEQYFCPIKHARKVLAAHARYRNFLAYGEEKNYHEKLEEFRSALDQIQEKTIRGQEK